MLCGTSEDSDAAVHLWEYSGAPTMARRILHSLVRSIFTRTCDHSARWGLLRWFKPCTLSSSPVPHTDACPLTLRLAM